MSHQRPLRSQCTGLGGSAASESQEFDCLYRRSGYGWTNGRWLYQGHELVAPQLYHVQLDYGPRYHLSSFGAIVDLGRPRG